MSETRKSAETPTSYVPRRRGRPKLLSRLRSAATHVRSLVHIPRILPPANAEGQFVDSEPGTSEPPAPAVVSFDEAKLVDLAVDVWKLDKNVRKAISLDENRSVKSSLGKLFAYLAYYGIDVRDYTGEKYYENMNVRVLSSEEIDDQEFPVVLETVKPAVMVDGKLVSHASVIVGMPAGYEGEDEDEAPEDLEEDAAVEAFEGTEGVEDIEESEVPEATEENAEDDDE